ncbi:unnamed protein product [Adineta ricciae]|nr:unnamed protein product [Adineta ricciae]
MDREYDDDSDMEIDESDYEAAPPKINLLIETGCISTKRHRFGIKLFAICDRQTGVMLDFIICAGSSTDLDLDQNLGKSGSPVMTVMKPYWSKGY